MFELNKVKYYTPREIADKAMIVNRKNKGDYGFVLRLIQQGKIKAQVFNEDSKIPYFMVTQAEIDKYNNRFAN